MNAKKPAKTPLTDALRKAAGAASKTPITDALREVAAEVIAGFDKVPQKTMARKLAEVLVTRVLQGSKESFIEFASRIGQKGPGR